MARTTVSKKQRGNACYDYRLSTDGNCELSRWLVADREAVAWMSNVKLSGFEVHHIAGRGKGDQFEWYCNLILVSKAAHAWIHHKPIEGEIACWYAKLLKHMAIQARIAGSGLKMLELDSRYLNWHPGTVDLVVDPFNGLAGRIEYLISKLQPGSMYESYGLEILKILEAL